MFPKLELTLVFLGPYMYGFETKSNITINKIVCVDAWPDIRIIKFGRCLLKKKKLNFFSSIILKPKFRDQFQI